MDCVGIIAEYNPFHDGHAYHMAQARLLSGCKYAAVIMSGNFVQRGDIAIFDKFYRTKAALLGGADIVFELPCAFSLACAEKFASAAVSILNGSGIVRTLSFGSESGDISMLESYAHDFLNESPEFSERLKLVLERGVSLAKARSEAAGVTLMPNDMLGTEYLKALKKYNSSILPIAVKRKGAMHDSAIADDSEFRSASDIRRMLLSGELNIEDAPSPVSAVKLSDVILYALRSLTKAQLCKLPDVSEGLENVIYSACRKAADYDEFLFLAKSKRYTLARIRRISLCALLGITAKLQTLPADGLYIRVLGVRRDSRFLLTELSSYSSLPVIKSFSDVASLAPNASNLLAIDRFSSDIYNIFAHKEAISDYTQPLIVV